MPKATNKTTRRKLGMSIGVRGPLTQSTRLASTKLASNQAGGINDVEDGASGSSEGMFVRQMTTTPIQKPKITRNKRGRPAQAQRPDEYEEDVSRKEGRQAFTQTEHSKARKVQTSKEVNAFKKHVEAEQRSLQNLTTNVNDTLLARIATSNDHFKIVYTTIILDGQSDNSPGQLLPRVIDPQLSQMYLHCRKLLLEATNIVKAYDTIESELQAHKDDIVPALNIEDTSEEIRCVIHAGHNAGLRKIEEGILGTPTAGDDDTGSKFYASGNEAASIWGRLVRKQERAFRRVATASNVQ